MLVFLVFFDVFLLNFGVMMFLLYFDVFGAFGVYGVCFSIPCVLYYLFTAVSTFQQ